MAEAAVATDDHIVQRFYCHMCNIKFESGSTTFSCPRCSDGFIEQLEQQDTDASGTSPFEYVSDSDEEMFDVYFGNSSQMQGNMRPPQTYENLLQEFIVNLGVNMMGGNGNMQLFLNPGDYAWGREGLDAIVTQLLNQIDTTGPPPLAKDVIDAIPIVEVSQEQVDTKLKCSVCWEEFQLREKVRQLACQHVYHEPCIRPWLELHSTCPICRQDLGSEDQSTTTAPDNSGGTTYNALQQLFQAVQDSTGQSGVSAISDLFSESSRDETTTNSTSSSSSREGCSDSSN